MYSRLIAAQAVLSRVPTELGAYHSFHFARIISYIKGKSHLLQDLDGWTSWLCVKNIFCKIATEKLGKEKGVDQFASKWYTNYSVLFRFIRIKRGLTCLINGDSIKNTWRSFEMIGLQWVYIFLQCPNIMTLLENRMKGIAGLIRLSAD